MRFPVSALRTLATLLVVSQATACAGWMANQGATETLQLEVLTAQQRAMVAETELERLTEKLDQLEQLLRDQGIGQESGMATMEALSREIAALRGQVEELGFAFEEQQADAAQRGVDQERRQLHDEARLRALEALLGAAPPPVPTLGLSGEEGEATEPDGGVVSGVVSVSTDQAATAEERLALAEQRMVDDQQVAARAILDAALKDFPDDPLLAVLRYRRAETLFNEGKWKEAARGFQTVTDKHASDARWASLAMLRIGECFEELGREDGARTFYDGVMRKYPGTEAATTAKEKLAN